MQLLDISQVAKQTDIAPSALRFYEEKGLIESVGRSGMKRLFEPNVIVQLAFIQLGKAAGFSLEEIGTIVATNDRPDIPRHRLLERIDELDTQIRRLKKLREAIRHVAECPYTSHMDCPQFQRLLHIGVKRRNKTGSA